MIYVRGRVGSLQFSRGVLIFGCANIDTETKLLIISVDNIFRRFSDTFVVQRVPIHQLVYLPLGTVDTRNSYRNRPVLLPITLNRKRIVLHISPKTNI